MLNKLEGFMRRYRMLQPGDRVICAVSGGADSVALMFAMYLLRQKLQISVAAAHFNHHLRGQESDRDEAFVRELCRDYDIELFVGSGQILPGKKGLEAAAREARYAFLKTLPGKIATAHTANDNAETVLMHMVRGTGLKGLGAIAPVNGQLIRPMLEVTRQEVLAFLKEYSLTYVTDSSNSSDCFLRNRLRRHVMPLLEQENPRLAQNLSEMALRLRWDENALQTMARTEELPSVSTLREMLPALRCRAIDAFLKRCGVTEPEAEHIRLVEKLIFSHKPSAKASLPGGVVILRTYDTLAPAGESAALTPRALPCPGTLELPGVGLRITCTPADRPCLKTDCFTVVPRGPIVVRSREPGDQLRLSGGTKQLKKLYIDRKLPAAVRALTPVLADDIGVLGVFGFGANLDRVAEELPAVQICFERIEKEIPDDKGY